MENLVPADDEIAHRQRLRHEERRRWFPLAQAAMVVLVVAVAVAALVWVGWFLHEQYRQQRELAAVLLDVRTRLDRLALDVVAAGQAAQDTNANLARQLQVMQGEISRLQDLSGKENRELVARNRDALDRQKQDIDDLLKQVAALESAVEAEDTGIGKRLDALTVRLDKALSGFARDGRTRTDNINQIQRQLAQATVTLNEELQELQKSVDANNQARRLINRRLQDLEKRILDLESRPVNDAVLSSSQENQQPR